MSEAWAGGSTRAWRRVRAYVLERDAAAGHRCRAHEDGWCSKPGVGAHVCTRTPDRAHHTLGRARTGDDPTYIVSACEACNLAIGDPATLPDPQGRGVTRW